MLKKLLVGLAMLTSVSMYAVPTLNVYNFEVKNDKEASYKSITEDYVNKTAIEQGDKLNSYIIEIYNDYLAFSNHTKNQTSADFKAMIPQIAEGNFNTTDIEVQFAKDKKIEQNENTFAVYTVIEVKPENNTEFAEFIKNRAEASFNENGTLLVYVGTDRRSPNKWCVFEVFTDMDSYLNQRAASYSKNFITETKDMVISQKRAELQALKLINQGGLDYKKLY